MSEHLEGQAVTINTLRDAALSHLASLAPQGERVLDLRKMPDFQACAIAAARAAKAR